MIQPNGRPEVGAFGSSAMNLERYSETAEP
jgi:hypothetical protein